MKHASPDIEVAGAAELARRQPHVASILVATDGSAESDGAIQLASAYHERTGAQFQAMSVCEPRVLTYDVPPGMPFYLPEDLTLATANQTASVRAQLVRLLGADTKCPAAVRVGAVGQEIAKHASEMGADLIIVGRGRHGFVDRVRGEEHLLRLIRAAECPILAAEAALVTPPRRVVIGIDFSAGNLAMARAAIALAAPDAVIYVAHVKPDLAFTVPRPAQWLKAYDESASTAVERLRAQLRLASTALVEPIVVTGHAGIGLASVARDVEADLVAVGAHGTGFLDRIIVGSVTTYLLRHAPCSLLVIPRDPLPAP